MTVRPTPIPADVGIGLMSGNSLSEVMSSLSPIDYVSAAIGGALVRTIHIVIRATTTMKKRACIT